jgi:hypothetical protein
VLLLLLLLQVLCSGVLLVLQVLVGAVGVLLVLVPLALLLQML